RPRVLEASIFRIVVRLATEEADRRWILPQIFRQAHEQTAAPHRKHERTAARQGLEHLRGDRLIAVRPERVEVRVDEVRLAFPSDIRGTAEQVAASPIDLDQLNAQRLQLLVL